MDKHNTLELDDFELEQFGDLFEERRQLLISPLRIAVDIDPNRAVDMSTRVLRCVERRAALLAMRTVREVQGPHQGKYAKWLDENFPSGG